MMVIEDLKKDGKIRISPISKETNSFDCPICGRLISPENPDSYSEIGYDENEGVLIQCKGCTTKIRVRAQTAPSRSICRQFRKPK